MNGVHDMGGMHNMGPIRPEKNEPVFHARWEGRIWAIGQATGAWRKWNGDSSRQASESIPPADYLSLSYFHKRFLRVVGQLVQAGMITSAELESGKPAKASSRSTPPLTAAQVPNFISSGAPKSRNVSVAPRFQVGERVRARNINPATHTRLPRYARGKLGTIERDHGVFVFPDTNAQLLGEKPQHVYSVRFSARELWGEQAAPQDTIYIAMWDDYLEHAE
jgi:nitrile hydratase subunit beta